MAFIPQNFVDKVGPPISAAWLNELDQLANNALQSAITVPALQAILGVPLGLPAFPLSIVNGGTGGTTQATAQAALGITQALVGTLLYPRSTAEIAAGVTPTLLFYYYGDLRRYGAVGDGATNDAAALGSALLVSNVHPVLIWNTLNGYVINSVQTLISGSVIYGYGRPLLKSLVAGSAILAGSALNEVAIYGTRFQGLNSYTQSTIGYGGFSPNNTGLISIDGSFDVRIVDCEASQFYNLYTIQNCKRMWMRNNRGTHFGLSCALVGSSTEFEVNGNDFVGCDVLYAPTFTVAPLAGATSATLTAAFIGPTAVYTVLFIEGGSFESRGVTLTNGQTTATWVPGLTANALAGTTAVSYAILATGNQAGGQTQKRNQMCFNELGDVTGWDGIGSHDFDGMEIIGNDIRNVRTGIDLGHLTRTNICRNALISANYIEATTADAWLGQSAAHYGVGVVGYDTGLGTITAVTNANPVVISVVNTFTVGDQVTISGVLGMTQLNSVNGIPYTITAQSAGSITLGAVNSTAFGVYSGGGVVNDFAHRVQRVVITGNAVNNFFNIAGTPAIAGTPGNIVVSNCDQVSVTGNIVANSGPVAAGAPLIGIYLTGGIFNGCTVSGNTLQGVLSSGAIRLLALTADTVAITGNSLMQVNPLTDAGISVTNGTVVSAFSMSGNVGNSSQPLAISTSTLIYNGFVVTGALAVSVVTPTYGASVSIDSSNGISIIQPNNGTAFSIANPLNAVPGGRLTITIKNTFGVLGAITFGTVYKVSGGNPFNGAPANGFKSTITFYNDGTNFVEESRSGPTVPN